MLFKLKIINFPLKHQHLDYIKIIQENPFNENKLNKNQCIYFHTDPYRATNFRVSKALWVTN